MPTSISVDNVAFREVSVVEGVNFDGSDSLTVTLRGASTLLQAARDSYARYSNYSGYPNMYLISKQSTDRGPVSDLILNYAGYIDSDLPQEGLLRSSDSTNLQSVELVSDEDENVTYSYYGQSSSYTWISRGATKPSRPKFGISVPSSLPIGFLFNPSPPNFEGSTTSAYKQGARLSQFEISRITPTLYVVNEVWQFTVEPV